MIPLTPEHAEEVRAIAAEMIGQALRDLRPAPSDTSDANATPSIELPNEGYFRLECLRLALDQHRFGMGPANASDEIVTVARKFHAFVSNAPAGSLADVEAQSDD